MGSSEIDAIVNEYFASLEAALAGLPAADRETLLAELRAHVNEARAGLPVENAVGIHEVLDRIGRPEDIAAEASGDTPASPRPSRRRALIAAATVSVLVVIAVVVGLVVSTSASSGAPVTVAPSVSVGGFPTGDAFDAASNTVYVSSGMSSALSIINAQTCNAANSRGCAGVKSVSTAGQDAIGVVVDEQTETVYAVNGSGSVAVINARTCNAVETSGCTKPPALVSVPGGPEFLALDQQTDTIYVADTGSGSVSVINGTTCNATDTRGCSAAPASVSVGGGPFPIAVDEDTNTVYVGTLGGGFGLASGGLVYVIDGNRCDSATTSGCAARPVSFSVGGGPSGIAIDPASNSVYVSSESGTVTVLDGATCDAADTVGCAKSHPSVPVGSDARGDAFDPATGTLYVTDAGQDEVSLINTAACNASTTSGCSVAAVAVPVGVSPRRIALDDGNDTAYVVDTVGNSVSMLNTRYCNANDTRGCPTQPAAEPSGQSIPGSRGLSPVALGSNSTCSPTTVASSSGGPASSLTATATQVASGTINGETWSLWSQKGQTGANGLEQGGLVVNGRAYGLCPGYPNPAELELLNTGTSGIVYGVIGYPGKATVKLSLGTVGTFTPGTSLPSPQVQVVNGVSFFIGSLPRSACDYPSLELDSTSPSYSAEHNLGFSGCTANQLVPITFSQGIWQLTPGAFVNNFGGGSGRLSSSGPIANVPLANSTCSPPTNATSSGGPASALTATAKQVASGTIDGQSWSLWSAKGQSGANGLEEGGLVVNGRAYGLCPGYRNPAELELLNTGTSGIVYGVIGYPGKATVKLSVGTVGSFTPGKLLPSPQVQVVNGVSFFIGTLPRSACDYQALELDSTSPGVSAEHDLGFSGCSANELVPITHSQGIWQLRPGKFVNNFGFAAASSSVASGGLVSRPTLTAVPGLTTAAAGFDAQPGTTVTVSQCARAWNSGAPAATQRWLGRQGAVAVTVRVGRMLALRGASYSSSSVISSSAGGAGVSVSPATGSIAGELGSRCIVDAFLGADRVLSVQGAWQAHGVVAWSGEVIHYPPAMATALRQAELRQAAPGQAASGQAEAAFSVSKVGRLTAR